MGSLAIPIGILPIIAPSYINSYNYVGNVDYNYSEKDQFRFRLVGNNQRSIDNQATLPAFFSSSPVNAYVVSASYLHTFSPNLLNEARLSYTRYFSDYPTGNFPFPGLDQFPNLSFNDDLNLQLGTRPERAAKVRPSTLTPSTTM